MLLRKRLFWQLYPSFLGIILISALIITVFACVSFQKLFYESTTANLESKAKLLLPSIRSKLEKSSLEGDNENWSALNDFIKKMGTESFIRITIILPSGKVIADSDHAIESLENHSNRPEFIDAINNGKGISTRHSNSLETKMMYVAFPVKSNDKNLAVLRISVAIDFIRQALWAIYFQVLAGGSVLVILVAIVTWFYARKISSPLELMKEQAELIAKGEYAGVAHTSPSVALEIEGLGDAINQMAFQLNSRMQTMLQQKNQLEAVLSSMAEGVVALDNNHKIFNLNRAAIDLLGLHNKQVINKSVEEVIRIPELHRFIRRVRDGAREIVDEVCFGDNNRYWQVHGTTLRGADQKELGVLLVFSDISRMRELEGHRRDFVANVSHELRTPLTSIKGFLETIKDGVQDKEQAKNFIDIALKHSDRLNAIIEDLLKLSKLENATESGDITLDHSSIYRVLVEAIELCDVKSKEKNITIKLDCPGGLAALINPPLLEQAIVNLIDNAIKYSEPNTTIVVRAYQENDRTIISVSDMGPGIAPEHLPRIFERFYRIDKARSRNMGGTGLGLSIVKHVALAHRGSAHVDSELGKGSKFSIHLRAFA